MFGDYKFNYDDFDLACRKLEEKYDRNRYPDPDDYFEEDEFDYEIERDEYYD